MTNQQETTKFEFLLTLDGNIICQRYFNVKNFNPSAKRSMNLHECVKKICEEISEDLKIKSSDYLCENQNLFLSPEYVEEPVENKNEYFLLRNKARRCCIYQKNIPCILLSP